MERNLIEIYDGDNARTALLQSDFAKSNFSYHQLISAFSFNYLVELCSYSEKFDNELLLKLLRHCYGINILKASNPCVRILGYSNTQEYLKEGYFIYDSANKKNNIALSVLVEI